VTTAGRRPALVLLAVLLAFVGGYVDGVGYLLLQHVFVAHQSGNTVASTVGVAQGNWSLTLRRGVPIGLFVVGIAFGAALLELGGRRRIAALTSVTLLIEMVLLVACMVTGAFVYRRGSLRPPDIGEYIGLLSLLVLAMGLQTATLRKIGRRTVRTTYVSGMLTHLAEETVGYLVARRDARADPLVRESLAERRRGVGVLARIWIAYAVGGIVGAYAELGWATYALAVPAGVLLLIILADQRHPWHAPNEDPLHQPRSETAVAR
jgi:uncharacterized membrane protein YoaK (UPF0700 family)